MFSPESSKLLPAHRERDAVVYIRQSSLKQVEHNLESRDLQYQLVRQAEMFGWPRAKIRVIDDDLGKSGASSAGRDGFQQLVAAVSLKEVGVILVTDVSRLARNCSDWYQLLDLASFFGTLISDASGLYEPRSFDDRLLLGMKGTFAEAQWFTMRGQLHAARLNKAKRGELHMRLPVGFEWAANGSIVRMPDADVQSALAIVFERFEALGNARAVLKHLRQQQLKLPALRYPGRELVWSKPSYQAVYQLLTHPAYAGAYTYGKKHGERLPGATGRVAYHPLPPEQWPVLLHDRLPGFISWSAYLRNRARLADNRPRGWASGAARPGAALLVGRVYCAKCGRPMHPHYTHSPRYVCDLAKRSHADEACQSIAIGPIDSVITEAFLAAVQPAALDVALAASQQLELRQASLAAHWQQRIQRAQFECELARRRYEQVDPNLRLVAHELEQRWEARLNEWQSLQKQWATLQHAAPSPAPTPAELNDLRTLATDLDALWHAPHVNNQDRKRLLRCLVKNVTLRATPTHTEIGVRWMTDAISQLSAPRPASGGPPAPSALKQRLADLATQLPDDLVAEQLNAEGVAMARNSGPWSMLRVRHFRNKHRIPSGCPYVARAPAAHAPRGDGLISASAAAKLLNTNFSMIADWFRRGLLAGHQHCPGTPLWVKLDPATLARLSGQAAVPANALPLAIAKTMLKLSPQQMRAAIAKAQLFLYRQPHGKTWRWFISPPPGLSFPNLATDSVAV